jgi:hypothetical protein
MNEPDRQHRINDLKNLRHVLLQRREQRGAAVASIDMELNVVRSELQAIYALHRLHGCPQQGANDTNYFLSRPAKLVTS